jgi:hypothetical protein
VPTTHDVFVSYNSRDYEAAQRIVDFLRGRELDVWFDQDNVTPGDRFAGEIASGLKTSSAVVVLVGPAGLGDYQKDEIKVANEYHQNSGIRLLNVFLPGYPQDAEDYLSETLATLSAVYFRKDIGEPTKLSQIIWGVTGVKPADKKGAPVAIVSETASTDTVADAAHRLVLAHERFKCLTFFVGTRYADVERLPRQCDIARDLLAGLDITAEERAILPTVDNLGTYFATKNDVLVLENRVAKMIYEGTRKSPPLHDLLARVIRRLEKAREGVPPPFPQLIVTTALDVLTERALLREGISFTRIVQHASATEITINQYTNVTAAGGKITVALPKGKPVTVDDGNWEKLDDLIAKFGEKRITTDSRESIENQVKVLRELPLMKYPAPLLYKYHGSRDVPGSCALSTEHYMRLATLLPIPERILAIVGNSAAAFLAHGVLDGDAMHVYNTLLRRSYQIDNQLPRIAAVRQPKADSNDAYLRLEAAVWPRVKEKVLQYRGIRMVEGDGDELLREMLDKLPLESSAVMS